MIPDSTVPLALRRLAGSNLTFKRGYLAAEYDARVGKPRPRKIRPVRATVSAPVVPAPAAPVPTEPEFQPVKAADIPANMKPAALRIARAEGGGEWRVVAVWNRESDRVKVYVRKHGASVRYAVAAI